MIPGIKALLGTFETGDLLQLLPNPLHLPISGLLPNITQHVLDQRNLCYSPSSIAKYQQRPCSEKTMTPLVVLFRTLENRHS